MASGVFKDELASVKNPDGTVALYQYRTNRTSKTTTVLSGQADNAGTNVVDGTRSVTVVGLAGPLLSNQVYDIASGLLLDQQIYSNFDAQHRPQTVTFLDNSTQVTVYGCCGSDSFTDRDGTVTSFGYDALKRRPRRRSMASPRSTAMMARIGSSAWCARAAMPRGCSGTATLTTWHAG